MGSALRLGIDFSPMLQFSFFVLLRGERSAHSDLMVRAQYPLSIVIPIYNEEKVLPALFRELERAREGILKPQGLVEIVLVNDGSKDTSWEMIADQCGRTPGYVGMNLSRNFGHQLALAAGLET